jgi:DNA-directed RNA polymerase sigma subunit (sigma70/sigma32)
MSITLDLAAPVATYEEIAEEMGMTRSGVRKLEQRALRKLHKALHDKGMSFDDLLPTHTHFESEYDGTQTKD